MKPPPHPTLTQESQSNISRIGDTIEANKLGKSLNDFGDYTST